MTEDTTITPDGQAVSEMKKHETRDKEKKGMNIKDITFGEIRCYLSCQDRFSICMLKTMQYDNFICLNDVPNTYDAYYVYGIGIIKSEFFEIDKLHYTVSGNRDDLVFLDCMEIMLSEVPKSVLVKQKKK
ncbi:MAG: hypothetical protein NC393_07360 [Clostridium sp.]|nr:hypothetical protein [Clostridium sp.]MCM1171929.1 hypothetical protein [Clostridium sp.]MCM1207905.1 hypothetical protein [Ruminococcus sp.]